MSSHFRFHTLLRYKSRIVDDRQMIMAEALRHLHWIESECRRVQTERSSLAEELHRALDGILEIGTVTLRYRHLESLDAVLARRTAELAQAQAVVDEAREALAAAMRERKTLEKLRDYASRESAEKRQKKEREEMDDLSIGRYIRSNGH